MSENYNNREEIFDDSEIVEEETSNASTIAGNPTVSRSDLIRNMVSYATKLGPEELADFVSRIGAAEEMTSPNDVNAQMDSALGTSDNSASNKASIKSASAPGEPNKGLPSAVKEDLALVFGNSLDLSEEFKDKVSTLFEAAVMTRVDIERVRIEEEVAAEAEEALEALQEEMEENIDAYLNYAVAEWMDQNKLAVQSNIKIDMAESFFNGLHNLFTEHYIDIPDEEVGVVESLMTEIEELRDYINETTEKNIELTKIVSQKEVSESASKFAENLTDTQKEKFTKLIEAVDYSSVEEFNKKANIIKETYFTKSDVKVNADQLISESVDEPAKAEYVDPDMKAYVQSLSRSIKK